MKSESPEQILQALRRLAASEANMSEEDATRIGRDSTLAVLGMDSVAAASFVVEMEVLFHVSLPPLLLFECKTVGDIVDRIQSLVGERG